MVQAAPQSSLGIAINQAKKMTLKATLTRMIMNMDTVEKQCMTWNPTDDI